MPEPPEDGDAELLGLLRGVSDKQLSDRVGEVEGLTAEGEERHKRGLRRETRQAITKLKVAGLYVSFGLLSLLGLFATIGIMIILYHWVGGFWNDPAKVDNFVTGVAWTILVALATLFFDRLNEDA